jgi:hypothetical protein
VGKAARDPGTGTGLDTDRTAAPNHRLGARIMLEADMQTTEQKVFQISIFLLNSKWYVECVIVLLNFLCKLIVFYRLKYDEKR